MKFPALFFLLILTCIYMSLAQVSERATDSGAAAGPSSPEDVTDDVITGSYGNCCLGYIKGMKASARRNIESFRMQQTDGDCNIRAVVFRMKKKPSHKTQRTRCANPNDLWVRELIQGINNRMQN